MLLWGKLLKEDQKQIWVVDMKEKSFFKSLLFFRVHSKEKDWNIPDINGKRRCNEAER